MSGHLNVARVVLDNPLPHLDRLFDYEIPEDLIDICNPGVKVKVKFSNRNMEAWVIERIGLSSHHKKLSPVTKVISHYPVLSPETVALSQIVADKFLGNLTDVLRFAVPPRQAKIEKNHISDLRESRTLIVGRKSNSMSLTFPPALHFESRIIKELVEIFETQRQSLVLFPNITLVDNFVQQINELAPQLKVKVLSAEQEPAQRYQSFLDIQRIKIDVVVGTRNAVFAPLSDLGLIAIWDDADENYFSQQSPYWNAREVALMRSKLNNCDILFFGNTESIAVNQLVKDEQIRRQTGIKEGQSNKYWPQIITLDNSSSDPRELSKRIPNKAWMVIKDGLVSGNVLIQVPRLGYSSNLQCSKCRESARCTECSGPLLTKQKNGSPECKWCGKMASNWKCRFCNSRDFRITVIGQTKTVEELGKTFPGIKIVTSGGSNILREIDLENCIVVATPGAEPVTKNGYSAAVLLDAYLLLGVPSLAASEECLRKWMRVITLVRSESQNGKVYITSDSSNRIVQALIKRDPNWLIDNERELREQTKLHPSLTTISLKGDLVEINQLLEKFKNETHLSILGPRIFEKEELAQIVIGTRSPEATLLKIRSEIIKFSTARTKPVRAHVDAYDID